MASTPGCRFPFENFKRRVGNHNRTCFDPFWSGISNSTTASSNGLRRTHGTGLIGQCGGAGALVGLRAGTPTTTNAAHYARIIVEHASLRRLVAAGSDIAELAYNTPTDVDATIDTAESILYTATHRRNTTPTTTLTENLSATLDRLEQLYEGHTVAGTPTGYLDYDTLTGGLHPGELTVIGARPAMGKSILGLGIAGHVAIKEGLPALHFSLEMSTHELTKRLLASVGGVELTRFRTGRFTENDWALITDAIGHISNAPLATNDSARLTILEVRAEARRVQQRHGTLGVIVVDYLQLMTGRNQENRQLEIAEVARGLKQLARAT